MTQQGAVSEFPSREAAQLWIEQRIVRFETGLTAGGVAGMSPGKMLDTTEPGFKLLPGDIPLSKWMKPERVSSRAFKVTRK